MVLFAESNREAVPNHFISCYYPQHVGDMSGSPSSLFISHASRENRACIEIINTPKLNTENKKELLTMLSNKIDSSISSSSCIIYRVFNPRLQKSKRKRRKTCWIHSCTFNPKPSRRPVPLVVIVTRLHEAVK